MERYENNRGSVLPFMYICCQKCLTKIAVSSFMGYMRGKSNTMIYKQFPELKYK